MFLFFLLFPFVSFTILTQLTLNYTVEGQKNQVEIWEDEKGMETILSPKINYCTIQREMKKMDSKIHTPTEQR
jgi:hypothetical protein